MKEVLKKIKFNLSAASIIVVVLTCLLIDIDFKNWEKQDRVIEHDVHWYYGYLPAQFIYDDIKLIKSDYNFGKNNYYFWPVFTPDGKKVIKTTMGLSILYAPFFLVAHATAILFHYPANGFSEPYKLFLLVSALFYLYIGLEYLKKTLRNFSFSERHIAITILLIGLGTNLLCYSSQSAPMSHVYNFSLISVFIYYTIKWYQAQSTKNTIILGLLLGLISLIRPSNVVIVLFFALYGISSWSDLKQRILFFKRDCFLLNVICLFALLVWVPQFLYWKTVTGNYIFYSYTDEGFFFSNPKILEGLFSFRKGWLVYTPLMAFALVGIFFLKDEAKKIRWASILFLTVNIYIIFSWWCWWYGGTYGQRGLIDGYALLAIPMASFVKYVSERKWYIHIPFYLTALFFIWLNIFQTYQFENLTLHYEAMTKKLYFKQFGKMGKIADYDKYLDWPDYEEAKTGKKTIHVTNNDKTIMNNYNGKKELHRRRIQLKAANGKYLSADETQEDKVIANRDQAFDWETFSLIMFEDNECGLLSHNSYFFCTELNKGNQVSANRTGLGNWETFTIIEVDSNMVAFKATNDKYLSLDNKTSLISAKSDSIGEQEKFELIVK